jgi:predicted flap endonuclease-1-like 5' DNA nuclease
MQGFLWLLLQMALLLLAAAGVFFMLGWRWRGQNATRDIQALNARIDAESATLKTVQDQRDAALSEDQILRSTQTKIQADLQEANDHRRNLERELIRVHDDLKSAKRDSEQRAEDLTAARAEIRPLQDQITSLKEQVEQLKKEAETLRSLPVALASPPDRSIQTESPAPTQVTEPVPEKPKRIRKPSTSGTKAPKASADVQATIIRLETEITAQQILVTALRQEHNDWQRRVSRLREKGNDPAGLGLATKSLQRSEAQVAEAQARLESLQRQNLTLHHSLEQAATITQDDDLTKIKGIKGVLSTQLHAYGIRTFRQIAEWTDADVEAFSELLSFKDRAKRDHWVQQAKDLLGGV